MRKCEYCVLEITRDTKALSSHSSSTLVSLVISKTPYSHFLLTVFSHCFQKISWPVMDFSYNIMSLCSFCSSTPTSPSGGQQAGASLAPKESKSSKILSPKKSLLAAKESSSGRRLDKNIKQLFGARMTSKGMINIVPIWVLHNTNTRPG